MIAGNNEQQARKLLGYTNGRVTAARIGILKILLDAETALSHQEVESAIQQQGLNFDRVTLYRVLEWLVEQDIAHKIAATDRIWRYNAQADMPSQHAHFHCAACEQVYCLESLQPALLIALPPGYKMDKMDLTLLGTCPDCH